MNATDYYNAMSKLHNAITAVARGVRLVYSYVTAVFFWAMFALLLTPVYLILFYGQSQFFYMIIAAALAYLLFLYMFVKPGWFILEEGFRVGYGKIFGQSFGK